jgi:hypothetical protein
LDPLPEVDGEEEEDVDDDSFAGDDEEDEPSLAAEPVEPAGLSDADALLRLSVR